MDQMSAPPPVPIINHPQSSPITINVDATAAAGAAALPAAPAPPPPPPPPPPALNGSAIPTIRLKSEIPERAEPPAKLQNAMMKDKKPFTYTPGGIDLSEIKSPRMARRIMRNAQEPEDVVLPPATSTPVSTVSLPPAAIAAMCPQIAIPVFPQNNMADRKSPNSQRNGQVVQTPMAPPPKPARAISPIPPTKTVPVQIAPALPKQNTVPNEIVLVTTESQPQTPSPPSKNCNQPRPVAAKNDSSPAKPAPPTFPTLREAPTPWLNKQQQPEQPQNVAPWRVQKNKDAKDTERTTKPEPVQTPVKVNTEAKSNRSTAGGRIIPVQIEGTTPATTQSKRWGGAKDNNEPLNNRASEAETKPTQSHSFKVLQKIAGSDDNSTDAPYNSDGVPLSQLRKLRLNDDDKAFMNQVRSQVDEDTFLHMETDPRYRGSVIPSRAFRMLQNMTDSGQVTTNNVVIIPINHTNDTINHNQTKTSHPVRNTVEIHVAPPSQPAAVQEIETKKNYIPPSERQVDQDLRRYMGSSIPSRSFKMLQAMTATQDPTENVNELATNIDEDNPLSRKIPFLPNPWYSAPKQPADVLSLWQNYRILYDFVFQQLPHLWAENCSKRHSPVVPPPSRCSPSECCDPEPANAAIVVADAENPRISRATKPGPKLVPRFHSEILQSQPEAANALIITQTDSENDVSVTVRIPLRRKRPSAENEFHGEVVPPKYVQSVATRNATGIPSLEYVTETQQKLQQSRMPRNMVTGKPHNVEPTDRCQGTVTSTFDGSRTTGRRILATSGANKRGDTSGPIDRMHSCEGLKIRNEGRQISLGNTDGDTIARYTRSRDTKYLKTNSLQNEVRANSTDKLVNSAQSSTGITTGSYRDNNTEKYSVVTQSCKNPHLNSIDSWPKNRSSSLYLPDERNSDKNSRTNSTHSSDTSTKCELIESTPSMERNCAPPTKSTSQANCKGSISDKIYRSDLTFGPTPTHQPEAQMGFHEEERVPGKYHAPCPGITLLGVHQKPTAITANPTRTEHTPSGYTRGKDYREISTFNEKEAPHKSSYGDVTNTQCNKAKLQTEISDGNSLGVFHSTDYSNANKSDEMRNSIEYPPNVSWQCQSSSDADSDSTDGSDSSVDFWKEIAENEDDLFFKTSKGRAEESEPADSQASGKPIWNLGEDVRDFCNYTELSDDTSSNGSGSSRNKDRTTDSPGSSSSDDNKSYDMYDFDRDEAGPPREDTKAEFAHLEDARQSTNGTDVDDDSGMNSDPGKISETESEAVSGSDPRKAGIKYERARTHSRLYRLLRAEDPKSAAAATESSAGDAKQTLSLPLRANPSFVDSVSSSSGVNSPVSPVVSERLVSELVQHTLKWRNGPDLGRFSLERLREIAVRGLQAADGSDSSRASSPYSPSGVRQQPVAASGTAGRGHALGHFDLQRSTAPSPRHPALDIFPSPAFKTLQSGRDSPKLWPKCPLVGESAPRGHHFSTHTSLQNGTSKR